MGRITLELVRKRAEHNDGEISTLQELALHQEKIIRIENLDHWCRHLKVLLLQNNAITKLENLSRFKCLEYLNLAMNNVEVIEGLEGCESLRKLDLTLNFIGQISSVVKLRSNHFLDQLYLTGNPCVDFSGYRNYVLSNVPQLHSLDGVDVSQSERIIARQTVSDLCSNVVQAEGKHFLKREKEKTMELLDINDENFWNTPSPDTPEVRAQIQRKLEDDEAKKRGSDKPKELCPPRKLFRDDGSPFNINEGKYVFNFHDDSKENVFVLEINIPKYMDTSLVDLDVQPTYVRAIIKNKIFQFVLPEEVTSSKTVAQRSLVTGHLVVKMSKLHHDDVITFKTDLCHKSQNKRSSNNIVDVVEEASVNNVFLAEKYEHGFNESEIPPLI